MKTKDKNHWITRKPCKNDKIPYDLLLLADETIEAINKYISESNKYVIEIDGTWI